MARWHWATCSWPWSAWRSRSPARPRAHPTPTNCSSNPCPPRPAPDVELNRPDVVAEVAAAFTAYEKALVAGDVTALSQAFWESTEVNRFGINDHQVGAAQLRAWREAQPPLPPGRTLVEPR